MNIKPKVSIIVPVYNVEKYLAKCMDSLLNQTLKDIEIILVDDESPDNCAQLCDDYAENDSRVKVIHKKNEGLGFARNSGLKIANGEFVAFVDSDDFVDVTMYEKLYNKAIEDNLDTVFSAGYYRYLETGQVDIHQETDLYICFDGSDICQNLLPNMIGSCPEHYSDVKYTMSVWRAIYSLEQIKDHNVLFNSEREVYSEDIIFHIDYLSHSERVGMIPDCLYYYRFNPTSLSTSYKYDRYFRTIKLYNSLKTKLEKLDIYQYCSLNLDRFYLCMTRGLIWSEIKANKDKNLRISNLNKIYNDGILREILANYPYKRLPLNYRVFFILLKYNMRYAISIILRTTRR